MSYYLVYGRERWIKICVFVSNFLHYLNLKHIYLLHMVSIKNRGKVNNCGVQEIFAFLSLFICIFVCACASTWMCKLCLIWRNIFSSLNLRMCEIESLDFMHESDCGVLLKYMQCEICHPPFCFHICTIKWKTKHLMLRK